MKLASDTFLIKVNTPVKSDSGIKGINGSSIKIDTDFNKYNYSQQIGTIHTLPIFITDKYHNDTEINVGDTVVFHHFVCQKDHLVDHIQNLYRLEYFHIYAMIKENEIIPIEDVIFVEPIMEKEEDIRMGSLQVKSKPELLVGQGTIFALSKKSKEAGLMMGDNVYFTKNADYPMTITDKNLYRMRLRNIIIVKRDDNIICPKGRVLIKEFPRKKSGYTFDKGTLQMKGEVIQVAEDIKTVKKGDLIDFFSKIGGGLEITGAMFYLIDERHINYKLN